MRPDGRAPVTKQGGFTLIEIIAVLLLIGVLAALAGSGLVATVQGYLLARESTSLSQKAELALTRLTREYRLCYDCNDGSPYEFTNFAGERTLSLNSGNLQINGDTLMDQVDNVEIIPNGEMIEITLDLEHKQAGSVLTFNTSVFPRNTYD